MVNFGFADAITAFVYITIQIEILESSKTLFLTRNLDIQTEPIFLVLEPVTVTGRKKWLQERIEQMDTTFFRELFPVLKRLFQKD